MSVAALPQRRRRPWCRLAGASLLILALVGGHIAGAGAQDAEGQEGLQGQQAPEAFSPARGHAQVIAQGVAPLPAGEVVWRIAYRELAPGSAAAFDARAAGFVVGDGGRLLVSDGAARPSLLVPGEGAFVSPGADGGREAVGEQPAAYYAIELVAAPGDDAPRDGDPVFRSDPFPSPGGERDLDLVRDVLAPGETTTVIGGGSPVLVLATLGALVVEATDGSAAPLALGDAAVFVGDVIVRAAGEAPAAFVAAVIGQDAVSAPEATPSTGAASGAPAGAATPGAADPNAAGRRAAATPSAATGAGPAVAAAAPGAPATAAAAGTGDASLAVIAHACPPGTTAATASDETCSPAPRSIQLALVAVGGTLGARDLGPPGIGLGDDAPTWLGLEPGGYILQARDFAGGFDRFAVPAQASFAASPDAGYPAGPDRGYPIAIDAAESLRLEVFALPGGDADASAPARAAAVGGGEAGGDDASANRSDAGDLDAATRAAADEDEGNDAARAETDATPTAEADLVRSTAVATPRRGSIGVRVFACPAVGAEFLDPAQCVPAVGPFDFELSGEEVESPLTLDDARPIGDGGYVWRDLEFGQYALRQPLLPAGTASYYVPGSAAVGFLSDATGYGIAIDASAPAIVVDVYDLAALPPAAPLPPVAPAAVPAAAAPVPNSAPAAEATAPPAPEPAAAPVPEPDPVTAAPPPPAGPIDSDGDSLTDEFEAGLGTSPTTWDSDGDGVNDGDEYFGGTSPFVPAAPAPPPAAEPAPPPAPDPGAIDSDGDGLTDAAEAAIGTDPFNGDGDGDGVSDGIEVNAGTNPFDPAQAPTG